jgi:hypothetical protein
VHKVARGWTVNDAMLQEFAQYLTDQRVRVDQAALTADAAFVRAMIKYEVDLDQFGVEEARRHLSRVDPQAQFALQFFEQARQLPGVTRRPD